MATNVSHQGDLALRSSAGSDHTYKLESSDALEKTTLSKLTEVIVHGHSLPNMSYGYENISTWENQTLATGLGGASAGHPADSDYDYYINGFATNVIVLLGLVGNILTIVILSQRAMRSSTNIYLSALAWWDTIVLLGTALLIGLPTAWPAYKRFVYAFVVSYLYPVALIAQTATIWLTVSFTVERYIAVCHPLKAASMCTIWRAKVVIAGVSLGSTFYNIPRWFDYRPMWITDSATNVTHVVPSPTTFSVNPIYVQVYFSWLYVPIMCIIPLVGLSVLNLFLVLAVRRSQKQRKDMNVKQSRENNVTIMLVSVVLVFIICQVPALVYNLAYAIDRKYVMSNFAYNVLSTLRNFLVTFNSAINFLLYCALGQKFRRIFLHTFCRKCVKENYMPMSGVYQHTTLVAMPSTRRQYNNRMMSARTKTSMDAINHSSSTNQTTGTSSQESSLMSPTSMSPGRGKSDRQVHTYAAPKMNMNMGICSHSSSGGGGGGVNGNDRGHNSSVKSTATKTTHLDSDEDPNYDVALESLLPESEREMYGSYGRDRMGRVNTTMAI